MESDTIINLSCNNCPHTWTVKRSELDGRFQVVYRGEKPQTYSVPCPQCGVHAVFDLPAQEASNG